MKVNVAKLSDDQIEASIEENKNDILSRIVISMTKEGLLVIDKNVDIGKFCDHLVQNSSEIAGGNFEKLAELQFIKLTTGLNASQLEIYKQLLGMIAKHIHEIMQKYIQKINNIQISIEQDSSATRIKIRGTLPENW